MSLHPPLAETYAHWWCQRCGIWTVIDDGDLCQSCSLRLCPRTGPPVPLWLRVARRLHDGVAPYLQWRG